MADNTQSEVDKIKEEISQLQGILNQKNVETSLLSTDTCQASICHPSEAVDSLTTTQASSRAVEVDDVELNAGNEDNCEEDISACSEAEAFNDGAIYFDEEDIGSLEACLELNQNYQILIKQHLLKVQHALAQNRERQREIKDEYHSLCPAKDKLKKERPLFGFNQSYFIGDLGQGPPPCNETIRRHAGGEPSPHTIPALKWQQSHVEKLRKGVESDGMQQKMQPILNRREVLMRKINTEDITKEDKDEMKKIILQLDESLAEIKNLPAKEHLGPRLRQVDFTKISIMDLEGSRTSFECQVQWRNQQHPDINQADWSPQEIRRLATAVNKHGEYDWYTVAEEVGGGRLPWQCLEVYQKEIPQEFDNVKFTKEEDELLMKLVESFRIGDHIPFQKVGYFMNRLRRQVIVRWNTKLDPKLKLGFWTPEEDQLLLEGVRKCGTHWTKLAEIIPGRHPTAIRERWLNSVNPSRKSGSWSIEEDIVLMEMIMKYGKGNWRHMAVELALQTGSKYQRSPNALVIRLRLLLVQINKFKRGIGTEAEDDDMNDHLVVDIKEEDEIPAEDSSLWMKKYVKHLKQKNVKKKQIMALVKEEKWDKIPKNSELSKIFKRGEINQIFNNKKPNETMGETTVLRRGKRKRKHIGWKEDSDEEDEEQDDDDDDQEEVESQPTEPKVQRKGGRKKHTLMDTIVTAQIQHLLKPYVGFISRERRLKIAKAKKTISTLKEMQLKRSNLVLYLALLKVFQVDLNTTASWIRHITNRRKLNVLSKVPSKRSLHKLKKGARAGNLKTPHLATVQENQTTSVNNVLQDNSFTTTPISLLNPQLQQAFSKSTVQGTELTEVNTRSHITLPNSVATLPVSQQQYVTLANVVTRIGTSGTTQCTVTPSVLTPMLQTLPNTNVQFPTLLSLKGNGQLQIRSVTPSIAGSLQTLEPNNNIGILTSATQQQLGEVQEKAVTPITVSTADGQTQPQTSLQPQSLRSTTNIQLLTPAIQRTEQIPATVIPTPHTGSQTIQPQTASQTIQPQTASQTIQPQTGLQAQRSVPNASIQLPTVQGTRPVQATVIPTTPGSLQTPQPQGNSHTIITGAGRMEAPRIQRQIPQSQGGFLQQPVQLSALQNFGIPTNLRTPLVNQGSRFVSLGALNQCLPFPHVGIQNQIGQINQPQLNILPLNIIQQVAALKNINIQAKNTTLQSPATTQNDSQSITTVIDSVPLKNTSTCTAAVPQLIQSNSTSNPIIITEETNKTMGSVVQTNDSIIPTFSQTVISGSVGNVIHLDQAEKEASSVLKNQDRSQKGTCVLLEKQTSGAIKGIYPTSEDATNDDVTCTSDYVSSSDVVASINNVAASSNNVATHTVTAPETLQVENQETVAPVTAAADLTPKRASANVITLQTPGQVSPVNLPRHPATQPVVNPLLFQTMSNVLAQRLPNIHQPSGIINIPGMGILLPLNLLQMSAQTMINTTNNQIRNPITPSPTQTPSLHTPTQNLNPTQSNSPKPTQPTPSNTLPTVSSHLPVNSFASHCLTSDSVTATHTSTMNSDGVKFTNIHLPYYESSLPANSRKILTIPDSNKEFSPEMLIIASQPNVERLSEGILNVPTRYFKFFDTIDMIVYRPGMVQAQQTADNSSGIHEPTNNRPAGMVSEHVSQPSIKTKAHRSSINKQLHLISTATNTSTHFHESLLRLIFRNPNYGQDNISIAYDDKGGQYLITCTKVQNVETKTSSVNVEIRLTTDNDQDKICAYFQDARRRKKPFRVEISGVGEYDVYEDVTLAIQNTTTVSSLLEKQRRQNQAVQLPYFPPNSDRLLGYVSLLQKQQRVSKGKTVKPTIKQAPVFTAEELTEADCLVSNTLGGTACQEPSTGIQLLPPNIGNIKAFRDLQLRQEILKKQTDGYVVPEYIQERHKIAVARNIGASTTDSTGNDSEDALYWIRQTHQYKLFNSRFRSLFAWPAMLSKIQTDGSSRQIENNVNE